MLARRFALAPNLPKYYPGISPYVLTLGVGFLNVIFGLLAFAGLMGVDIHCNYSRSLFGSILLSAVYGAGTGNYLPGFLASLSHFIVDIVIHDQDIMLEHFTKIMIGGTKHVGKLSYVCILLLHWLCV